MNSDSHTDASAVVLRAVPPASTAGKKGATGKRAKLEQAGEVAGEVENSGPTSTQESLGSYWLMKSEPESRLEKGVDVKVGRVSGLRKGLHGFHLLCWTWSVGRL